MNMTMRQLSAYMARDFGDADSTSQPAPVPGTVSVTDEVIKDLDFRREFGRKKYGTELYAFNGRDPLVDAYQEVLDLAVYLKQKLIEQGQ